MRAYLSEFFKEFSYGEADAAFLLDTYDRIAASGEAFSLWEEALGLYDADCKCDYAAVIKKADGAAAITGAHEYTAELLVFICLTRRLRERYAERGLDPEIYRNSVLDLRYKLEECKIVKGIVGSFVAAWFSGFFDFTRFALGRLQFEMTDFGMDYEGHGYVLTPESRVINVHIPRTGTPMDKESCDDAYRRAKEFFKAETGDVCVFHCHSWLLYPENLTILPPHTNIYRFLSEYEIVSSHTSRDGNDLWRLFDTDERNPDRLPTNTSVRRLYVEHLKKGGRVGSGKGIFFA